MKYLRVGKTGLKPLIRKMKVVDTVEAHAMLKPYGQRVWYSDPTKPSWPMEDYDIIGRCVVLRDKEGFTLTLREDVYLEIVGLGFVDKGGEP